MSNVTLIRNAYASIGGVLPVPWCSSCILKLNGMKPKEIHICPVERPLLARQYSVK